MRRLKTFKPELMSEFELDLAPLLAVMVKLVPVLLVSSAFVQMGMIETELPQVVQQAIQENQQNPIAKISVFVSRKSGYSIQIDENGKLSNFSIPNKNDGSLNFESLHSKLIEVKKLYPSVFKLDLVPDADVAYKDIVRTMDESRKPRDHSIKFPLKDKETEYMFPEVAFANTMEG